MPIRKTSQAISATLSLRELDKMLKDIENMAKTGARDAAKQMLGQMRELLENLNRGRPQPSKRAQQHAQTARPAGQNDHATAQTAR